MHDRVPMGSMAAGPKDKPGDKVKAGPREERPAGPGAQAKPRNENATHELAGTSTSGEETERSTAKRDGKDDLLH